MGNWSGGHFCDAAVQQQGYRYISAFSLLLQALSLPQKRTSTGDTISTCYQFLHIVYTGWQDSSTDTFPFDF